MHYKSIFISDIHLGSRGCQADALCLFLKNNTCDNLFLVGDVIDGWQLKKRWYFPQSHANVIRRILTAAKRGTNVYYILGNHDEAFRKFLQFDIEIGNIKILDRYSYTALNGKSYLVIHGDFFDSLMLDKKWLMHVGDTLYNILIWFNIHFNSFRKLIGLPYWSLSNWLKQSTKEAVNFITNFENHVSDYCNKEGYDGIICGHIHTAKIKLIDNIEYMNDGDWVESGSAIVEHLDGRFELLHSTVEVV
jgi:UDP-2,3-diacylglucosamine pyrophosphatase LpxH